VAPCTTLLALPETAQVSLRYCTPQPVQGRDTRVGCMMVVVRLNTPLEGVVCRSLEVANTLTLEACTTVQVLAKCRTMQAKLETIRLENRMLAGMIMSHEEAACRSLEVANTLPLEACTTVQVLAKCMTLQAKLE